MPLDEDVLGYPVLALDVTSFPKLEGAKAGQDGKISGDFKVMHDELSGEVHLELHHLEIETENMADKAVKELQGPEDTPAEKEDEENDDI